MYGSSRFAKGAAFGIRFADTGPGIPAVDRQSVFRRFYRAEESWNKPGNGLGLSLTYAIAAMHMSVDILDVPLGCTVQSIRRTADRERPA